MSGEKELNANFFDQLTLAERIERQLIRDGEEARPVEMPGPCFYVEK